MSSTLLTQMAGLEMDDPAQLLLDPLLYVYSVNQSCTQLNYCYVGSGPSHAPTFQVKLHYPLLNKEYVAVGRSKKSAKQNVNRLIIEDLVGAVRLGQLSYSKRIFKAAPGSPDEVRVQSNQEAQFEQDWNSSPKKARIQPEMMSNTTQVQSNTVEINMPAFTSFDTFQSKLWESDTVDEVGLHVKPYVPPKPTSAGSHLKFLPNQNFPVVQEGNASIDVNSGASEHIFINRRSQVRVTPVPGFTSFDSPQAKSWKSGTAGTSHSGKSSCLQNQTLLVTEKASAAFGVNPEASGAILFTLPEIQKAPTAESRETPAILQKKNAEMEVNVEDFAADLVNLPEARVESSGGPLSVLPKNNAALEINHQASSTLFFNCSGEQGAKPIPAETLLVLNEANTVTEVNRETSAAVSINWSNAQTAEAKSPEPLPVLNESIAVTDEVNPSRKLDGSITRKSTKQSATVFFRSPEVQSAKPESPELVACDINVTDPPSRAGSPESWSVSEEENECMEVNPGDTEAVSVNWSEAQIAEAETSEPLPALEKANTAIGVHPESPTSVLGDSPEMQPTKPESLEPIAVVDIDEPNPPPCPSTSDYDTAPRFKVKKTDTEKAGLSKLKINPSWFSVRDLEEWNPTDDPSDDEDESWERSHNRVNSRAPEVILRDREATMLVGAKKVPFLRKRFVPAEVSTDSDTSSAGESTAAESNSVTVPEPFNVNPVAVKLVKNMGWSPGQGLGKAKQGRTLPVQAVARSSKEFYAGLGYP